MIRVVRFDQIGSQKDCSHHEGYDAANHVARCKRRLEWQLMHTSLCKPTKMNALASHRSKHQRGIYVPEISVERSQKVFSHRPVKEDLLVSICPTCFRTVAFATHDEDLTRHELKHECSPYDLAHLPNFGPH
jgi:hypothetical protein